MAQDVGGSAFLLTGCGVVIRGRLRLIAALIPALLLSSAWLGAAGLIGVVRHAATGEPLEKVRIQLTVSAGVVPGPIVTGPDGRFRFEGLSAGTCEISASAVGFGFLKRALKLADGEPTALEILLAPGTVVTDELTVEADQERSSGQLSAAEVHQLKSVLMDDPLRALKQLPSLASGDDFNSAFAVQGSGFDRVAVLLDGIPVYSFLHTAEGLEDTGSTSVLSADLLEDASLQLPGTSGRWSGTSAGHLGLRTRTGNPDRLRSLATISGSAFLAVGEGPLDRGNWIAAARKSYIDWIVRRVDPGSTLNFGFYDLFGKVVRPLGASHQLTVSGFHGATGLRDVVEGSAVNSVENGRFVSDLFHLEWSGAFSSRLTGAAHLYFQSGRSRNRNSSDQTLWRNQENILGIRSNWDMQLAPRLILGAGAALERWDVSNSRYFYAFPGGSGLVTADPTENLPGAIPGFAEPTRTASAGGGADSYQTRFTWSEFDEARNRGSLFAEARFEPVRTLTLRAGWAFDHQAGLGKGYHSPTLGLSWQPVSGQRCLFSWGRGGQIPFFNQLFDRFGNPSLEPERARSLNLQWDWDAEGGFGLSLAGYLRRRDDVPWRPDGLWRLVGGSIAPPLLDPYRNALEDRSHGAEIRIRRSVANGFSGWAAYAWGVSRWSEGPGRTFPGNYDQRHGVGLYGHYRWSSAFELSMKWRWATGLPIPAYARRTGSVYYLAEARNQERLGDYSRLDCRLGKSFDRDRFRMTLFVEVLNLLNRDNVRFSGHDVDSVNPTTGRIYGLVQNQIPILPTAGLTIEF